MGMGKFGQGDPTKTQHQISSSNTGVHHLAGDLVIEGDLSVSGSTTFAAGGGARSVAGDTDNGIISWKTSDNTFIVESGVLITADGHLSASKKLYVEKDVEIADNLLVSGSVTAGGGISIPDDQTLTFGTNNDVSVEYDEDGNDVLLFNRGFRVERNHNGVVSVLCKNDQAGTSANARFQVQANGGAGMTMAAYDDGHSDAEFADKGLLFTDTGATALALMSRATAGTIELYTGGNAAGNKRVVVTKDGHLSASQKLYVERDVEIADDLLVSGSGTFKGGGLTVEATGGDSILTLKDTDGGSTGDRMYIKGTDSGDNQVWQIGDSNSGNTNATFLAGLAQAGDTIGNAIVGTKTTDGGFVRLAPLRDASRSLTVETTGQVTIAKRLSQSAQGGSNVFMDDVIIGQKGNSTFFNLFVSGGVTAGTVDPYQISQSFGGQGATNFFSNTVIVGKINGGANANLQVSGTADVAGQLSVGPSNAEGVIASRGDHDLKLKTGNSTTGVITITDGANGDITFSPNGTGDVVADGILKPNDGIAIDKGSAGAVTAATPGGAGQPNGTVTGMTTQRAGTFVATMDSTGGGGSDFTFSNNSVISIQVNNNLVVSTDVIAVTATTQAATGILAGCIAIAPSSNFFRIGLHNVGGGDISPGGTVTVNWVIL